MDKLYRSVVWQLDEYGFEYPLQSFAHEWEALDFIAEWHKDPENERLRGVWYENTVYTKLKDYDDNFDDDFDDDFDDFDNDYAPIDLNDYEIFD